VGETPHLFILITDDNFDNLKDNEIVLSYSDHAAVMGPLMALLRKFNHSSKPKIETT
jgi:hypothetical protein